MLPKKTKLHIAGETTMKIQALIPVLALVVAGAAHAATQLDQKSATVSLAVAPFAAITNLNNIVLTTTGTSGAAGAVYSGSGGYHLESNSQVSVSLTGGNLSNGTSQIATSYDLDGSGMTYNTAANSVHNADHTIDASATLGAISAQQAGNYSSVITVTVSSM